MSRPLRFPALHRLTALGINAALGVWAFEALCVLVALVLMNRGGEAGRAAARLVDEHSLPLLAAQGAATALILICTLVRQSLHAEPLAPFDYTWMSALLTMLLFGSTVYILLVGARDFEKNQVIIARISNNVQMAPDSRDPKNPFGVRMLVKKEETTPEQILQSYKEASAELSIVSSLGAASAIGLLILNFLGWRERADY